MEYMSENRDMVERLFSELNIEIVSRKQVSVIREESIFLGKSFCVTGSFEGISRDEIHEIVEKHGGEVRTAVTGKLDYLIV